jgi:hypothetical protein
MSYYLKSYQDYAKNLTCSNIPEYFVKNQDEGDSKKGVMGFKTADLDDVYEEIANIEVRWEETNPVRYHVGKDSTTLMNEYIEIGVGFTEKKLVKINGHDAYYMVGSRREAKQSRIYNTSYILANFCCPVTKRQFTARVSVYRDNLPKMIDHIQGIINGIICH